MSHFLGDLWVKTSYLYIQDLTVTNRILTQIDCFSSIDWSAPWLANYKALGQTVLSTRYMLTAKGEIDRSKNNILVNALNANKGTLSFDFLDQNELEERFTYESFIDQSNCIPTRENVHDFFNGLSWIQYPGIKKAMLAEQAAALRANQNVDQGIKINDMRNLSNLPNQFNTLKAPNTTNTINARGAVRDALTVFDENGILLQADQRIWDALERKDWSALFIKHRKLWESAVVWIFGHALLEKLIKPRASITGHVLCLKIPLELGAEEIDSWVAQRFNQLSWSNKPFTPMQVLGVPGWWCENESPTFYDNPKVFRS